MAPLPRRRYACRALHLISTHTHTRAFSLSALRLQVKKIQVLIRKTYEANADERKKLSGAAVYTPYDELVFERCAQ